jgi:hypothetical protein
MNLLPIDIQRPKEIVGLETAATMKLYERLQNSLLDMQG